MTLFFSFGLDVANGKLSTLRTRLASKTRYEKACMLGSCLCQNALVRMS